MASLLTYNVADGLLSGKIGDIAIDGYAGSGGRAGSKTKGAENWFLKNNPFATGVHQGTHQYGPLPIGKYDMRPHETDKLKVRLDPFPSNSMHGRSGFEIHGRGTIGSHGCIVPYDPKVLHLICHAVKKCVDNKEDCPTLEVVAIGTDLDAKMRTA